MTQPTSQDLRNQIQLLLVDVLALVDDPDWSTIGLHMTSQWDSLVHMALVERLETQFHLELTAEEIFKLRSLDDILGVLESRGVVAA